MTNTSTGIYLMSVFIIGMLVGLADIDTLPGLLLVTGSAIAGWVVLLMWRRKKK